MFENCTSQFFSRESFKMINITENKVLSSERSSWPGPV